MNKLIVPFILALILTSSCSKKASEIADNTVTQSPTPEPTILNAKLPNFCEGHECPEGIVAIKTSDKLKTCAGIPKSTTEVLVSQNCLGEEVDLNIQTPDGLLIKVDSIEEEITNEFDDKVLKLNLSKELSTTSNISIPGEENKMVKLFNFNELGELNTQECELTYASLAYANSFNNESQLLNIKNCDGVKEGSLISQDGNVIGFLTKKNSEIELYEGINIGGEYQNINLMTKIEELSYQIATDSVLQIGYMAFAYPINDFETLKEQVTFERDSFSFSSTLICFKQGQDAIHNDIKTTIIFDNSIQELNENTRDFTFTTKNYIPRKDIFFGYKLAPQISSKYNYITTTQNIDSIEKHYFRNPFNNEIISEYFKFSFEKHKLTTIDYCN